MNWLAMDVQMAFFEREGREEREESSGGRGYGGKKIISGSNGQPPSRKFN